MSYRRLLIHTCDIHHLKTETVAGKYGVPDEETFSYSSTPDVFNEPCYFFKDRAFTVQVEPHQQINQTFNVHFLPTSAIRHNDKVIFNGSEFIIDNPLSIRGHHIEATAKRVIK